MTITAEPESIAQLIERLGPPPPAIIDDWIAQLAVAADIRKQAARGDFELRNVATQYSVDLQNRLVKIAKQAEPTDLFDLPDCSAEAAHQRHGAADIDRTRRRPPRSRRVKAGDRRRQRAFLLAGLGCGVALTGWGLSGRSSSPTKQHTPPQPIASSDTFNPRSVANLNATLKRKQPVAVEEERVTEEEPAELSIFDEWESAVDLDVSPADISLQNRSEVSAQELQPTDDVHPDREVRVGSLNGLELPPVGDLQARRLVCQGLPQEVTFESLQPPAAVRLETEDSRWLFRSVDPPQGGPLAILESSDPGCTFRWTENAQGDSAVKQIAAGRLRIRVDGQEYVRYLRPSLEIGPLEFDFQEQDQKMAWHLGTPPPAGDSQLDLSFVLPSSIDLSWLMPPTTDAPRETTSVVQLAAAGNQDVALQVRYDLRIATRLTCRRRLYARLDSQLPWFPLSAPKLKEWMNQRFLLQKQQGIVLASIEQQYAEADSSTRRQLRPQREALRQSLKQIESILVRSSELSHLINSLASPASLQMKVTVQWPQKKQVIFRTTDADISPAQDERDDYHVVRFQDDPQGMPEERPL